MILLRLVFAALRVIELLLVARILLGWVHMPALRPLERGVRQLTAPFVGFVRARMDHQSSPESATWVALILIWLIRLGLSMLLF